MTFTWTNKLLSEVHAPAHQELWKDIFTVVWRLWEVRDKLPQQLYSPLLELFHLSIQTPARRESIRSAKTLPALVERLREAYLALTPQDFPFGFQQFADQQISLLELELEKYTPLIESLSSAHELAMDHYSALLEEGLWTCDSVSQDPEALFKEVIQTQKSFIAGGQQRELEAYLQACQPLLERLELLPMAAARERFWYEKLTALQERLQLAAFLEFG